MRKAIIDVYMANRGFGFLKEAETGQDYFFHASNFQGKPRPGAVVSFELVDGNRAGQKPQAVNVQILEESPVNLDELEAYRQQVKDIYSAAIRDLDTHDTSFLIRKTIAALEALPVPVGIMPTSASKEVR